MNKEDPYRERAEKNRQRISRPEPDPNDVSSMPSRSKVHQDKKKKTVFKLKYPIIRLLVLFFILLPITVITVISYMDENQSEQTLKTGYDMVSLEERENEVSIENKENTEEVQSPETSDGADEEATSTMSPASPAGQPVSEGKDKETLSSENANAETPRQVTSSNSAPKAENQSADNSQSNDESSKGKTENGKPESEQKVLYHTVKPGETLFRIAMTYYKSQSGIEIIRNANGIIENEIQTGQTLKIPVK
ncbi:hypothetical protein AM500_10045 [Bacillus sp. FJAT-18017]|uniref:LysM peptidoglycan-binding domain-containing protein n=1 Tax=Bacillus sp. FJAT-18017 TaxID=1705566 RepID=UPI0006B03515|nr:LysM peptidoglycan-binding domain-containing protein [Bacillus sp. FJAT-18017]ALC90086.1 hypothetical protein AM500_10045 [Bacillus sp. FJAT-18017]